MLIARPILEIMNFLSNHNSVYYTLLSPPPCLPLHTPAESAVIDTRNHNTTYDNHVVDICFDENFILFAQYFFITVFNFVVGFGWRRDLIAPKNKIR